MMNERILELAKQAGLKKAHGSDREYMGDFDWREFADLIVRECCTKMALEIMDHYVDDALKNTYEHFGVEE
jgi:hypothetical protein